MSILVFIDILKIIVAHSTSEWKCTLTCFVWPSLRVSGELCSIEVSIWHCIILSRMYRYTMINLCNLIAWYIILPIYVKGYQLWTEKSVPLRLPHLLCSERWNIRISGCWLSHVKPSMVRNLTQLLLNTVCTVNWIYAVLFRLLNVYTNI